MDTAHLRNARIAGVVGHVPALSLLVVSQSYVKDLLVSTSDDYPYFDAIVGTAVFVAAAHFALRCSGSRDDVGARAAPGKRRTVIRLAAILTTSALVSVWLALFLPPLGDPLTIESAIGTGLGTMGTSSASGIAGEMGLIASFSLAFALPMGAYSALTALLGTENGRGATRSAWIALGLFGATTALATRGLPPLSIHGTLANVALAVGLVAAARSSPLQKRTTAPSSRVRRVVGRSFAVGLSILLLVGWGLAEMRVAAWMSTDSLDDRPLAPVASGRMLDATVAMEDGSFYRHRGFDFPAMHRALRKDLREGRVVQGGSTISQQLAKNLFLESDRTPWRKLKEAFLTVALERRLTKRRILETYVRVIDYGQGRRGVDQAAAGYFHKRPSELNLAEAAVLTGLAPFSPKGELPYDRIDDGRRAALSRVSYFFPNRYSRRELDAAESIPLERLLYPLKDAWDRHATEEAPAVWHGVAAYFDLSPDRPSRIAMMHVSLRRALGAFFVEAHERLGLVGIDHIGVFNDRAQRGAATTLSAHAFGQAIDLSGFRFQDGAHIRVQDHAEPSAARSLLRVEKALRRHFDIVVDWREDPRRHDNHLHAEIRGPRSFPIRPSDDTGL